MYEVRGTFNKSEDVDPYLLETDILTNRLKELPNGEVFAKKDKDMKRLTAIYYKCFREDRKTKTRTYLNPTLTKDELTFLYEINGPIEGFGYHKDPRIKELRDKRNPKEDAPIVLGCRPEEVAWKQEDITDQTKAYIGPLFPGVFSPLTHLEHVYTSFPEGRFQRYSIEIGGKTRAQLEAELRARNFQISDFALHMMKQPEFTTTEQKERAELIRLTVGDLFGDQNVHTTDEIYQKANQLGLDLCPAEVGPHLRMKLKDQPMGDWFSVAMKQIADPGGDLSVFSVARDGGGSWLSRSWAEPGRRWGPGDGFVFRLRK